MKESTKELVHTWAKQNKVGREKLEQFIDYILVMEAPAIPEEKETAPRGRKTTDESLRIREQIQAMQESLKGKLFTSKELAQTLDADPAYVSNNLRWLGDNKGLVKIVGRKDREQGGRGRKENIWAIAQ